MTEADAIKNTQTPATVESLKADLAALGLEAGQLVIVHSSLSALGWVVGGAQAVLAALTETLTDTGTLVMPAFSGGNSDPSNWRNPPVPQTWWQTVRDNMPAFDHKLTPTRALGVLPELFRRAPDVRRSDHPGSSFCAWGRYAHAITVDHRLNSAFGEDSPLARIYDLNGKVLLLGVNHANNTSLHLAECRSEWANNAQVKQGAAVMFEDGRQWVQFNDVDYDSDDFEEIGKAFETASGCNVGKTGAGESRLMNQTALVDFGIDWLNTHRK